MGYRYKWKPSKAAVQEFAEQMKEITRFCVENHISHSSGHDSYYFSVDGQKYRVSNHSVESSNKRAFNEYGNQIRDIYHPDGREDDTIYIHAGKTRIIQIYNDLKAGRKLDGRGNVVS